MEETENKGESPGKPDEFWRRVYLAVIAVTVIVVTALWSFTRYFSS